MLRAAQAAVNKPWMTNNASAFLHPLPQRQRALSPLSKHSRASFESIPREGQIEFICPEKKLCAFIGEKAEEGTNETPKKTSPSNASSQRPCVWRML